MEYITTSANRGIVRFLIFLLLFSDIAYSGTYSPPNIPLPPPDTLTSTYNFVVGFINGVGSNVKLQELKNKVDSEKQKGNPSYQPTTEELKPVVTDYTNKWAIEKSKQIPYVEKMHNVNFDVNLQFWESTPTPPAPKVVKYGLIVTDISPGPIVSGNMIANTGDVTEDDLKKASKAKVKYTIGPIEEDSHFPHIVDTESNQKPSLPFKVPQLKFKTKVTPVFSEPLAGSMTPSWKVNVLQEDGYYELFYESKKDQSNTEHQFKVPVYENMSYGRRYNKDRQLMRTSIFNLLRSNYAFIDVHHLNLDHAYQSDLKLVRNNYELGIQGQFEEQQLEANKGKYALTYKISF